MQKLGNLIGLLFCGLALSVSQIQAAQNPIKLAVKQQLDLVLERKLVLQFLPNTVYLAPTIRTIQDMLCAVPLPDGRLLCSPEDFVSGIYDAKLQRAVGLFQQQFLQISPRTAQWGKLDSETLSRLIAIAGQQNEPFVMNWYLNAITLADIHAGRAILSMHGPVCSPALIQDIQSRLARVRTRDGKEIYALSRFNSGHYDAAMAEVVSDFQLRFMNMPRSSWSFGQFGPSTLDTLDKVLVNTPGDVSRYAPATTLTDVLLGQGTISAGGTYSEKDIETIQQLLKEIKRRNEQLSYSIESFSPGKFDSHMKLAVQVFQKAFMDIDPPKHFSGEIGALTLRKMYREAHRAIPEISDKEKLARAKARRERL